MKVKLSISSDELIFREVWIGGALKEELLQKLEENQIGVNELGLKIINHQSFKTSSVKEKVQIVEMSVGDLGFLDGATTSEVYQKAQEIGLRLCPAELGPHMRLQYIDTTQPIDPPKGNWQSIAMKELCLEPDFPQGFYLRRREDGFWLRGYRASFDFLWKPSDRFIFLLKRLSLN